MGKRTDRKTGVTMNIIKLSLILYPSVPGYETDYEKVRHPVSYNWEQRMRWVKGQIRKYS